MGISDHWGKPKNIFKRLFGHCKPKESLQMLQFSELSQRNEGPIFQILRFINDFKLSPLNGISCRFL